jgi:hypothetical protein
MHTVELLDEALRVLGQLGYAIREACLGGDGGGCEIRGRKVFFLDLDLDAGEQLEQVLETLRREPADCLVSISPTLARMLKLRKIA